MLWVCHILPLLCWVLFPLFTFWRFYHKCILNFVEIFFSLSNISLYRYTTISVRTSWVPLVLTIVNIAAVTVHRKVSLWIQYSIVIVKVAQYCLTLCNPMDYTGHGILYARILEWVAFPSSRRSSRPRDRIRSPALWQILYHLSHQGYRFSTKLGKNLGVWVPDHGKSTFSFVRSCQIAFQSDWPICIPNSNEQEFCYFALLINNWYY